MGLGVGFHSNPNITMEMIKENPDETMGLEIGFLIMNLLKDKE